MMHQNGTGSPSVTSASPLLVSFSGLNQPKNSKVVPISEQLENLNPYLREAAYMAAAMVSTITRKLPWMPLHAQLARDMRALLRRHYEHTLPANGTICNACGGQSFNLITTDDGEDIRCCHCGAIGDYIAVEDLCKPVLVEEVFS
jgi:hypothetical protein